jgi:hypothetical protein
LNNKTVVFRRENNKVVVLLKLLFGTLIPDEKEDEEMCINKLRVMCVMCKTPKLFLFKEEQRNKKCLGFVNGRV